MRRARGTSVRDGRTRVAVVIDDVEAAGAQRAAIDQAAWLDPAEWQVELASLETRPASDRGTRLPPHLTVRRPGLAGLSGWLRAFSPDLVHSHLARATIACGLAVPLTRVPAWVATCHDLSDWQERRHHPLPWLARAALHRCDAVVAASEAIRSAIGEHDARLGARTQVVRNGTDLSAFSAVRGMRAAAREVLGYRAGTFVVGTVARLEPRKGVDILLAAASEALHRVPGLELLVVGDGVERARLSTIAVQQGLSTRVRFVGEQRDVRPYLAAFDLFATPSRSEGLGLALVEALAAGIPTAGARVGGIPEVLDGGAAGWLVEPTPHAWAELIVRAARAPGELQRMSCAGPERAREFSMESTRSRLVELYRAALGEHGLSHPIGERAA